jgi:integrase/recombinase XerD
LTIASHYSVRSLAFTQEAHMSHLRSANDAWLSQLAVHLKNERYVSTVVRNYTAAVNRFIEYLDRKGVAIEAVQSTEVDRYLAALRFCRKYRKRRAQRSKWLRRLHRSAIHMLMSVVHGRWPIAPPPTTECELIHRQIISGYDAWMGDLRGLAAETRSDRRAEADRFLKWLTEHGKTNPAALIVADIDAYMQSRAASVRRTSCRGIATKLRSFLRHLYFAGIIERDLSTAVIGPTLYAYEGIPSALRAEDIQKVLKVTRQDRSAIGRRDYAILMLLSAYGLRAGEITSLLLEDIDWKHSRLHVRHSKTGAHSALPLLREPGEAILDYLRDGRPKTERREVFMRSRAPYRAFATGSSLYTPIGRRLAMAAIKPTGKKGPHAFRHARAVTLLRSKVPLKLIGDVLGHRSTRSTGAYLKLATEDLRSVALEIPAEVRT